MDCGRRGGRGGGTRLILISSVSLGRNASGWDPMGGDPVATRPLPQPLLSPHCFPASVRRLQESNFGWIQYEFFPRFFMPFMKTRSAFNAFLWPTPVFFFFPFLLFKPLQTFMSFSRRFFRSVKLSLISKRCPLKRRLTQRGSCHLRLGLRVAHLAGSRVRVWVGGTFQFRNIKQLDLLHGHAVKRPRQAAAAGGNKLSANVEGKKIRAARPW